jgi:hypothetical protein
MKHLTLGLHEPMRTHAEAWDIQRAIRYQYGVVRVYMHPALGIAYVDYDPHITSPDELLAALHRIGLHATLLPMPAEYARGPWSPSMNGALRASATPKLDHVRARSRRFASLLAAAGLLLLAAIVFADACAYAPFA